MSLILALSALPDPRCGNAQRNRGKTPGGQLAARSLTRSGSAGTLAAPATPSRSPR